MRPWLVALALVAIVVAGAYASSRLTTASPAMQPVGTLAVTPPRETVVYGHIKSLVRKGNRFELRFDPAWWLQGVTAQRAAVEDKVIRPGESIPNDYYVRDESHRLLTFRVPATARATVIAVRIRPLTISVSELAQIVKGKNPKRRQLFDGSNHLGYWIRVAGDTVRSLDQQYQP